MVQEAGTPHVQEAGPGRQSSGGDLVRRQREVPRGRDLGGERRGPGRAQSARRGLHQLIDTLDDVPAMLLGRRTDVLGTNRLARALLTDFDALPAKDRNYARRMFLDPQARERLVDWDAQARTVVENLRLDAGRDPHDPATQALVGELTIASPELARWWEEHRVHQRTFGDKHFRHPVVGEMTLQHETLTTPGDPDQALFLLTAEPGSPSREALDMLDAHRVALDRGAGLGAGVGGAEVLHTATMPGRQMVFAEFFDDDRIAPLQLRHDGAEHLEKGGR